MVLFELGQKLESAMKKMQATHVVDEEVVSQLLQEIARALLEADVNVRTVGQLKQAIKLRIDLEETPEGTDRRRLVQKAVTTELTALVKPDTEPYVMKKGKPNVIMFVGLQGSGKTTSIAKFANHYLRKGWKCAMVCADTFRAGAYDQLKQNATKLRCPFYGSYTEADPVAIAHDGVKQFKSEGYEVIIVDTSGRHKQESALFEEMQDIREAVSPDNIVFILDATQGQAVHDQAASFHEAVEVGSCVITKLDGHAKGGGALSAVAATGAPIIFLGSGEHFDAFEPFQAESFISKLLGFGDGKSLVESIQESMGGVDHKEKMRERMAQGKFTLRDMGEHFRSTKGVMGKLMGMIPGLPPGLLGDGGPAGESQARTKKYLCMMDSMTNAELDGKADFDKQPSRIERVARGSGTHPQEVMSLLKAHKQMEAMVKKMGKAQQLQAKGGKGGKGNALAKGLGGGGPFGGMDPAMMQQAMSMMGGGGGGAGGLGGAGGMPGMASMLQNPAMMEQAMKMMGGGGGGVPGGKGGMPDMAQMAKLFGGGGMGGGMS